MCKCTCACISAHICMHLCVHPYLHHYCLVSQSMWNLYVGWHVETYLSECIFNQRMCFYIRVCKRTFVWVHGVHCTHIWVWGKNGEMSKPMKLNVLVDKYHAICKPETTFKKCLILGTIWAPKYSSSWTHSGKKWEKSVGKIWFYWNLKFFG